MILISSASSRLLVPIQVTLAHGDTVDFLEVSKVELEGGALVIFGKNHKLVVAFGPGAWLEVQPK